MGVNGERRKKKKERKRGKGKVGRAEWEREEGLFPFYIYPNFLFI